MSVFRPEVMVCPSCGHRNEETVAVSLHGPRVPSVVASVLDGTFQCFSCAGCGLPYRADGPILYIDFVRKHWVGEIPKSMERSWSLLELQPMDVFRQSLIDLAPAFLRSEADGFTVRCVFGLDALAEKILLLTAGVDDRDVEIAKLALTLQLAAPLHPALRPRVTAIDDDSVTFVVRATPDEGEDARPASEVTVARAEISRLGRDPEWARVRAELQIGPYVDLGRLVLDGRAPLATPA